MYTKKESPVIFQEGPWNEVDRVHGYRDSDINLRMMAEKALFN